jgi:glucose/arabinose dehydrogenase
VTVKERNFASHQVLRPDAADRVETGPFSPYGTKVTEGQRIEGRVPCNGAVMRIPLTGGAPELEAWGFRNPFGLAFSPDGRLFVTDNGYDDRGSRPVHGAGDLLWSVTRGTWYGWPDFHGNMPLDRGDHFIPPGKFGPELLLAAHPGTPPKPAAVLDVHSSSDGFDFSREHTFGYVGQAFIAQFGDLAPEVGKVLSPVGFKVVRVDVQSGVVDEFAVNKGKVNGPASWLKAGGLERPIAVRFDPSAAALYIVDFGVMTASKKGLEAHKGTGVLWRVVRNTNG